jgi:hypothetical protein
MGKQLAPTAVRRSHGSEGTKDHSSYCYLFFNKRNTDHLQIQTYTVKYPDFPSAMRPVPHSEELAVAKRPEYLTVSDGSPDSDEYHGQQDEDNVGSSPTFEASRSSSEPPLLTQ